MAEYKTKKHKENNMNPIAIKLLLLTNPQTYPKLSPQAKDTLLQELQRRLTIMDNIPPKLNTNNQYSKKFYTK